MTKRLWLLAVALMISVTVFLALRRARREAVVAWLEQQEGTSVRRVSSAPGWFRDAFGKSLGRRVFGTRVVDVILMEANRASMAKALSVQGLERLFVFRGERISDADLSPLENLTDLVSLTLNCRKVGDATLQGISRQTRLHSLDLSGTTVTDRARVYLRDLESLRILRLPKQTVSEEAVETLRQSLPACRIERSEPLLQVRSMGEERGGDWAD